MAESNTSYPLPSPAPELPTPHAPGFFPETPAFDAYAQNEGPLEKAGRDIPVNQDKALGGALLGAGVGALLGGPIGALVGGGVAGLAGLEEQGLHAKFGKSPAQQQVEATEHKTAAALKESPAQRMLAEDGGSQQESLSALLAGGAGAHTLDREVDEPTAEKVDPATLSGLPVAHESVVDMPPVVATDLTPDEEKPEEGLTGNQKAALGAGAGLAAGGLAGAAFAARDDVSDDHAVSKFDSPYTPGLDATPGAPTSTNPAIVGPAPAVTPAPVEKPITSSSTTNTTSNIVHNPEYTPISNPDSVAEQAVARQPESTTSRAEEAAPYTAAGAGAAALAGAGAATALPVEDEEVPVEDEKVLPGAQEDEVERAALDREAAQVPGVTDEAVDHKRKMAETATGAALGAIGGATAVEALEKAGGGKEDAEFPAEEDPAAALAAQLAGKDSISPQSRFYEGLDGAPSPASRAPIPPHLKSRFSDATVDTLASTRSDTTIDGLPVTYDDQRAVAPVPLFRQGSYLGDDSNKTPESNRIEPEALAATAAVASVPGFVHSNNESSAFQDFAHLSQPEGSPSTSALATPSGSEATTPAAVVAEDDPHSFNKGAVAAGVGAGAVGGGLAAHYVAQHEGQATPPPTSSLGAAGTPTAGESAGALPHSPKHLNLREQLGIGAGNDNAPSTPSSTRAIKGSPTHTGATTPASFSQGGEYTPPMSEQAAFVATPYAAQQDYYAGTKDHQQTFSPTRQPEEQSSYDAQEQYQQQEEQQQHYNPVERSPHMKIATRKDSIGHKRLHKKSLGDPTTQQQPPQQQPARSPVLAGAAGGEFGAHSPARTGSPLGSGSPRATEGEGIWNGAVANVVNDETVHRGGHRPALVTIDSEDRRDHVMDRMVGVSDPAHSTHAPASAHSRSRSTSSQHDSHHSPISPASPSASSTPRKLTRNRRSSSVTEGGEKKEGFLSKVFGGGHKKSGSRSGAGEPGLSPRGSVDAGRVSGEAGRQ